ncbi:Hypothetical protein CINCED_3A021187 [Cinara cedri]|uniref:Uncharacterized protein n=1 Tax=Cinara cedri TaxID=506608 RepID=A0A5E4N1D5_9HEMI|nr:Hypothetical protein CINCED_3A021187 [Cinara cedri]
MSFKKYEYVAPVPPTGLIGCNNYTLSFTERKFVNIGIDPTDTFPVKVQIITPSRYVYQTPDVLTQIFSLMDEILSILLDTAKYKFHLFLETAIFKLSRCVYKKENVLALESKTATGCRIILNKQDLFALQNLELCIFETVARKTAISRPSVLKQFSQIVRCTDAEITKMTTPPAHINGIQMFIESLPENRLLAGT